MVQRGNGLRLALEAFAELGSGDFDRNVALQTRVSRAIHLAHPTGADGGEDLIGADVIA